MAASRYAIGGVPFVEKTENRVEQRCRGRVQDADLNLPQWTVAREEIDETVARKYASPRSA